MIKSMINGGEGKCGAFRWAVSGDFSKGMTFELRPRMREKEIVMREKEIVVLRLVILKGP